MFMTMQGWDHLRIAMCMAAVMFMASADALSGIPIKGQLAAGPSFQRVCSTFGMMSVMRAQGLRGGDSFEEDIDRVIDKMAEDIRPMQPVQFQWPDKGERMVEVSGSWDDWATPVMLEKKGSHFVGTLRLPEGKFLYKFIIDNEKWVCSDEMEMMTDHGGHSNNIMVVSAECEKRSHSSEGVSSNKGGVKGKLFGRFGLKEVRAIAVDVLKGGLVAAFVAATGYWLCNKDLA